MIVLVIIIALIVLACIGAIWASRLPGGVTVDFGAGTSYEFELVYALLAIIVLGVIIAMLWSLLSGIVTLPKRFTRSRRASKVKDANRALADGLLAAEAGDGALAKKLAKKAAQHADDDRLKLLLEARAAEVSDDWTSAERAWGQLARLPGGQLAGLRGSASAAHARGDILTAEDRARQALELKSNADWPFNSLFDSQVTAGQWDAALSTLATGEKRGLITGDSLRRRRAVLLTASALRKQNDERKAAQSQLADAIRAAPSFPPASYHGARQLMIDGKLKAAQGVLELGWKIRPHPALAHLSRRLDMNASLEQVTARLSALVKANPDHRESRILQAEIDMMARNWTEAVKTLAALVEETPTARICLLLETALRGYGDAAEADRWGRMAVTAPREPEWSDIAPKTGAFQFEPQDWARMVYAFGDTEKLVHPRYERAERDLEAGRQLSLPSPKGKAALPEVTSQPLDYVPEE